MRRLASMFFWVALLAVGLLWYWPLAIGTCLAFILTRPRNKKWLLLLLALLLIVYGLLNPETSAAAAYFAEMLINIAFAIVFAIIQFVAIFWFMSQTKIEVIRPGDPKAVTFEDYYGQPNLVAMARQVTETLKGRRTLRSMGGSPLKGILLAGKPGTGKTYLAKAMAGTAGIAFISIEGSAFRGMFWGMDVLRMIQFVGKAKGLARQYGACIAFIDEIDAVGMSRGGAGGITNTFFGNASGSLTRLLYEMDGIEEPSWREKILGRFLGLFGKKLPARDWHVLFLGSTNRPDVLDPALVRPGRMDKIITVDYPTRTDREKIIAGYLRKVKHDGRINVPWLAQYTGFASPAMIAAAITRDAVRIAFSQGRQAIIQRDIEDALQEQALGLEQPIEDLTDDQKRQVSVHEAGHAVAQYHLMRNELIARVSIIRRSGALGYMMPTPKHDIYTMPLRDLWADICVSLMGDVATQEILGEPWTGAIADYQSVAEKVRYLAASGHWGLQGVLAASASSPAAIAAEAGKSFEDILEQCRRFAHEHRHEIEALADRLYEKGDLTGEEAMSIIKEAISARRSQGQTATGQGGI